MAYDFPSNPTENQEYTPPLGGQTYIYNAPRWLVKGIPPAGGGSGSGIADAPLDGQQYGRTSAAWTVVTPNPTWTTLTGKPTTFPPTLPIAWTDLSGTPTTFPPTLPIDWADVSNQPTTFSPTLPIASSGVTGLDAKQISQDSAIATKLNSSSYTAADVLTKLKTVDGVGSGLDADLLDGLSSAAFAPTVHTHVESDITGLATDLAAKASLASPTFTGDPQAPTQAAGDNDASIATTAFVTSAVATAVAAKLGDAPVDGKLYARQNGAWVVVDMPFTTDVNGDVILKFSATTMVRIKPNGLILTKDDIEVFSASV